MTISSEMIYTVGLTLIGIFGLIAAITIPIFLISGNMLRKRLEDEYGAMERAGGQSESNLSNRFIPFFAGSAKHGANKRHRKR